MVRSMVALLVVAVLALVAPVLQFRALAEPVIGYRPLTWADFQGQAPDPLPSEGGVTIRAESVVGIEISEWQCPQGPLPRVRAVFDQGASWSAGGTAQNPALLAHEQGHFDIAQIHARKLQAEIDKLQKELDKAKTAEDCQKLQDKIAKLYADAQAAEGKDQEKYDKDTAHGSNAKAQEQWAKKIAKDLGK